MQENISQTDKQTITTYLICSSVALYLIYTDGNYILGIHSCLCRGCYFHRASSFYMYSQPETRKWIGQRLHEKIIQFKVDCCEFEASADHEFERRSIWLSTHFQSFLFLSINGSTLKACTVEPCGFQSFSSYLGSFRCLTIIQHFMLCEQCRTKTFTSEKKSSFLLDY